MEDMITITTPERVIELTEEEWNTITSQITLRWAETRPESKVSQLLDSVLAKIWGRA